MVNFDEFGPEKIIEVYDPQIRMHGFVVIDNTALGPAKGGIRMTPSVSIEEVSRLARAMTWKCALAELPFGGGKSGIVADPKKMDIKKKHSIVAAFARALKPVSPSLYIAAPDINTGEEEMAVYASANGSLKSTTGKPASMEGLPHELGSTGFGVFHAAAVAMEHQKIKMKGSSIAIEGFGNVGTFAMKFFTEAGARVVAVSDSKGTIYSEKGLDYKKLMKTKKETRSVVNYDGGKKMTNADIFGLEVDILVPSALPDVINKDNVGKIRAKIVAEGANIPMTAEMEEILHKRGILVVPDFVANAGGVISSYAEYTGMTEDKMFKLVEEKIRKNTRLVLDMSKKKMPRDAAMDIAAERVRRGMRENKIQK